MNEYELVTDQSLVSGDGEVIVWLPEGKRSESLHANVDPFLTELGAVAGPAVDLVRIATAALVADRRTVRRVGWSRSIGLRVHVTALEAWRSGVTAIAQLLGFLTGDEWRIELVQDRSEPTQEVRRPGQVDRVILFSGGLDSFAGAVVAVGGGGGAGFLSDRDNPIVAGSQSAAWEWLSRHVPNDAQRESILLRQVKPVIEPSSRSRSLMFIALGVAAATARGATRLEMPENGHTSFNPPLGPDRGGALSTRSTHPTTLWLVNELIMRLGLTVSVVNPYEWLTKGELLGEAARVSGIDIAGGVGVTLSCGKTDGRWYRGGDSHLNCGLCVNCLVRRASILAAGMSDETRYVVNVVGEEARRELIRARRGDIYAVKELLVRGVTADELIASAPYPSDYDVERAAAVCDRAVRELRAIDFP